MDPRLRGNDGSLQLAGTAISFFRVFVIVLSLLGPGHADAHVVYDRRTLRQWAQEADVIVVAQFRSGMQVWRAPDESDAQEFFSVRVLETLRGTVAGNIEFFAHAEGEPRWRPGDVAILFFDRTAEHGEFARVAQRFPYFSVQGAGHEWTLAPATRDEVVSIARRWATVHQPLPPEDLRTAFLRELRSGDTRLHADALAELAHAGCGAPLFADATAVEPFAALVTTGTLSAASRMALARALDGCPQFDVAGALRQLTEQPLAPRERIALIRAAGMTRDTTLGEWLVGLLTDPDPMVRREAIAALGHPWHTLGIAPLAKIAATDEDAAATAAVRALAAIATPAAYAALMELAQGPRPLIANAARAYLKKMPTPVR